MDFHVVFGLHFHQWLNVAHEGADRSARTNAVAVVFDVGEHGVDVVSVKRSSPREAEVDFLNAKLFHVTQQLNLLLNRRVSCAGALQTIPQRFVIKPYAMGVIGCISVEFVLNRVPIVYQ